MPVSHAHSDFIRAIKLLRCTLRPSTSFYHIYGHQDKDNPHQDLPQEPQLNVIVDCEAQAHYDKCFVDSSFDNNIIFPTEGWYVSLGHVKVVDKHRHAV